MAESFDVFLSHNSKDKPAVREVGMALRVRGLKVWLDEWELVPGRPWQEALERIIETIGCAVVLVGRDGLGPWEDREMRACLSEFVSRGLPVIPVLLPGAPDKPVLPLMLRQFTWVDLRFGLTDEGVDRLLWGITGKRPELCPTPRVHQPVTEPLTGICFFWMPGGRFQMGGNVSPDEKPIHWVRISPFRLAETPVTNRQYAVFLEKTGAREPAYWRDQRFSALDQPVVGVSWDDAQGFCSWLSTVLGQRVLLPSEAQWEFAARGTDGREYPWGNEPPDGIRACFGLDFRKSQPSAVGSFPAGRGPFGTLDQAGNVWEWCRDAWNAVAYRERHVREISDPVVESGSTERRTIRGGCWISSAEYLRAAYRYLLPAEFRDLIIGFRVAAVPPSTLKP
jgi:formylglycine-generating enzyme required for sulfatase activity